MREALAHFRSLWFWVSLALLALLMVFLLYPVATIFLGSFGKSGSGWAIVANDPRYLRAIGNIPGVHSVERV